MSLAEINTSGKRIAYLVDVAFHDVKYYVQIACVFCCSERLLTILGPRARCDRNVAECSSIELR